MSTHKMEKSTEEKPIPCKPMVVEGVVTTKSKDKIDIFNGKEIIEMPEFGSEYQCRVDVRVNAWIEKKEQQA